MSRRRCRAPEHSSPPLARPPAAESGRIQGALLVRNRSIGSRWRRRWGPQLEGLSEQTLRAEPFDGTGGSLATARRTSSRFGHPGIPLSIVIRITGLRQKMTRTGNQEPRDVKRSRISSSTSLGWATVAAISSRTRAAYRRRRRYTAAWIAASVEPRSAAIVA